MSRGRHCRPGKTAKAAAAGLPAFAAVTVAATPFAHHPAPPPRHPGTTPAVQLTAAVTPDMRAAAAAHAVTAALTGYTVRAGNTLSQIAQDYCGDAADYPSLAAASGITDPNVIIPGQYITISCQHPVTAPPQQQYTPPQQQDSDDDGTGGSAGQQQQPAQEVTAAAGGSYAGSGGMQSCIIARESGGNSQVMNSTGHYGLYQFSYSTWTGHGGNPADFGHASVAEQNQVYDNTVAADGYSDWAPYDGC